VAPLDVTTPAFTPLSSRAVYRTSDPEVATREAARLFARHRLRVLDGPTRFDAMANVGDLSGVAINYVTLCTPVQIEPVSITAPGRRSLAAGSGERVAE
jgi:hypothetical protein